MRTINTDEIIQTVKKMCIEANLKLSEDMGKGSQKCRNRRRQCTWQTDSDTVM